MKKALFTLLLFCLGFFVSACGGGGGGSGQSYTVIPIINETPAPQETTTTYNPNLPTLEVSKHEINFEFDNQDNPTENITVTLNGQDVTSQATFTSTDESVVTVDSNGKITFVGEGTANIIVHVEGANDQIITVTVSLPEITLSDTEITLTKGNTYNLTAKVKGKDIISKATLTSNATNIATIAQNGLITAVNEGTATITVDIDNAKQAIIKVNVYDPFMHTIVTDFEEMEIGIDETKNISVTVGGKDKTKNSATTYSSSDESIATVDENGLITGIAEGTAVITVKVTDTEADKLITVTVIDNSVAVALDNDVLDQLHQLGIITYDSARKTALTSIDIPSTFTYDGTKYKITSIGEKAFQNCSSLSEVNIPNTVTKIGKYAFDGCISLESIDIPNSVTEIANRAFRGCKFLISITVPKNLEKIGEEVFRGCTALSEFKMPNTVTEVGNSVFIYCYALKTINLSNSITKLGTNIFEECNSIESINIPEGITEIGNRAFYKCANLKTVTLPSTLKTIGDYSFRECTSLENITLPESLESLGGASFYNCSSLKAITIPDSVTFIGNIAFKYCTSLESAVIGKGITNITFDSNSGVSGTDSVTGTFSCCNNLKNITLSSNITQIDNDTFDTSNSWNGYTLLNLTIIDGGNHTIGTFPSNIEYRILNITIEAGIATIENNAFNNQNINTITIPSSVTEIGENAFSGVKHIYYTGPVVDDGNHWGANAIN